MSKTKMVLMENFPPRVPTYIGLQEKVFSLLCAKSALSGVSSDFPSDWGLVQPLTSPFPMPPASRGRNWARAKDSWVFCQKPQTPCPIPRKRALISRDALASTFPRFSNLHYLIATNNSPFLPSVIGKHPSTKPPPHSRPG